jgi:hypothetical protein
MTINPHTTSPTVEPRATGKADGAPASYPALEQDLAVASFPSGNLRTISVETDKAHVAGPSVSAETTQDTEQTSSTSPATDKEKQTLLRKLYTDSAIAVVSFMTPGVIGLVTYGGWVNVAIPGALIAVTLAGLAVKRADILRGHE